jgi:hypothetical protein
MEDSFLFVNVDWKKKELTFSLLVLLSNLICNNKTRGEFCKMIVSKYVYLKNRWYIYVKIKITNLWEIWDLLDFKIGGKIFPIIFD